MVDASFSPAGRLYVSATSTSAASAFWRRSASCSASHPNETPTVERIAELADVSPATVFNLVGPRERQWAALCDALLRELDARLAFTGDEGPRERAHRIVGEAAHLFIADAAVFRHLVNSWGRSGSLVQENPIPRAARRSAPRTGDRAAQA